jgi:steroid 5-alpha reductase family enzyme
MIITGMLLNLLIGAGTLTVLWFFYLYKKNPGVVDLGWAIGLSLMGLTHNLAVGDLTGSKILTSVLVVFWGLRLGGYLFWTRLRLGKKDARYESLQQKKKMPAPVFFLIHYLIQACFQAVVGYVFIFTAQTTGYDSVYTITGLVVWCVGFGGSVAADAQLHNFRILPENRGKVCQVGLWYYSRHPNYFFEILLWSGFSIIGLPTHLGWLGLISPVVLLLTMRFITGPISERQSLKSKPDSYRQYQETTAMMIPWLKKEPG